MAKVTDPIAEAEENVREARRVFDAAARNLEDKQRELQQVGQVLRDQRMKG